MVVVKKLSYVKLIIFFWPNGNYCATFLQKNVFFSWFKSNQTRIWIFYIEWKYVWYFHLHRKNICLTLVLCFIFQIFNTNILIKWISSKKISNKLCFCSIKLVLNIVVWLANIVYAVEWLAEFLKHTIVQSRQYKNVKSIQLCLLFGQTSVSSPKAFLNWSTVIFTQHKIIKFNH